MLVENSKFKLAVSLLIAAVLVVDVGAQSSCTTTRLEPGMCVPILTCKPITQLLNSAPRPLPPSIIELVQRSHCGTFNDVHYVCCAQDGGGGGGSVTRAPPTPTTQRFDAGGDSGSGPRVRPSVSKSDADVRAGMSILGGLVCGKSQADRVANGEMANLSEFPWMALLVYSDGLDRTLDCGGSLITDRYVLTAAHCIRARNKKLVSVRLGEHDTQETIDCVGKADKKKCAPPIQEIDIEESVYHQDYNAAKFSDDIGLIRLKSKAVFRTNVQPICLPITEASKQASINRMIIAGWGRIETGIKANILQKAVVPVKGIDYCQKIHRILQLSDKQLCAGGENEIDTCKGDSGGPIFNSAKYRLSARYVQYGVVSAGSSLCGSNFPGIYVRVISYLPWIAGNISP